MKLSAAELSFVEKREKLTRYWPLFGGFILLLLVVLAIWLWVKVPYMVNPWVVAAGLKTGTLPESTLVLMAAMLPIMMLTFLVFAVAVVLLAFAAVSNERKLIGFIQVTGVLPGSTASNGSG
ncbi:hypothetical protein [Zobellella aerophila]|uniref:Uncharacterized protein n=1 Tax=Zobellella aerophila TaxID=870480 RepID=A0ABP6VA40_9GAMM